MSDQVLDKGQASEIYGPDFVRMFMKGKSKITLGVHDQILFRKWKMIKDRAFTPFAYEYVYLIHDGGTMFKVGVTVRPRSRLNSISSSSPTKMTLRGALVVGGHQGRNLERALHNALKDRGKHARGEWFKGLVEQEWRFIEEFAKTQYAHCLVSLSDAWEGCEPLMKLYCEVHKDDRPQVEWVKKGRDEFLWLIDQMEKAEAGA